VNWLLHTALAGLVAKCYPAAAVQSALQTAPVYQSCIISLSRYYKTRCQDWLMWSCLDCYQCAILAVNVKQACRHDSLAIIPCAHCLHDHSTQSTHCHWLPLIADCLSRWTKLTRAYRIITYSSDDGTICGFLYNRQLTWCCESTKAFDIERVWFV